MADTKTNKVMKRMIFPNMDKNPLDSMKGSGNSFLGTERVGIDSVVDPLITGYAFIKWVRVPAWFDKNEDLKNFKHLTETFMKSFNGVNDIELNTAQRQTGFGNRSIDTATGISNNNTDFSIEFDELSGSVFRNMFYTWINMIYDENTGVPRYPEIYGVEFASRNHTADLLYVMVRPDVDNIGNKNRVEYAAYYQNVFPTNVPDSSLYNYQLGSNDTPKITINFKGFCTRGRAINNYALKVLDEEIVTRKADADGKIFLDVFNSDKEVTDILKTSGATKIFLEGLDESK